jgi:hypothetical protein
VLGPEVTGRGGAPRHVPLSGPVVLIHCCRSDLLRCQHLIMGSPTMKVIKTALAVRGGP